MMYICEDILSCVCVYLQYKHFGSMWSYMCMMPCCVFIHSCTPLWLLWIPVLWNVILVHQVLQDGITTT